jgi:GNAT superfamily N-acetyltransferase
VARPATADDVDGICSVCAATLRETYRGIYPPGEIEAMIAELYRPDLIRSEIGAADGWWGWVVAEVGGVVTAAGAGGPSGPDVCELYALCVDPQMQRCGLGTAVLDRFTLQAQAAGGLPPAHHCGAVECQEPRVLPSARVRGAPPAT